jgi:hypothetical protein
MWIVESIGGLINGTCPSLWINDSSEAVIDAYHSTSVMLCLQHATFERFHSRLSSGRAQLNAQTREPGSAKTQLHSPDTPINQQQPFFSRRGAKNLASSAGSNSACRRKKPAALSCLRLLTCPLQLASDNHLHSLGTRAELQRRWPIYACCQPAEIRRQSSAAAPAVRLLIPASQTETGTRLRVARQKFWTGRQVIGRDSYPTSLTNFSPRPSLLRTWLLPPSSLLQIRLPSLGRR